MICARIRYAFFSRSRVPKRARQSTRASRTQNTRVQFRPTSRTRTVCLARGDELAEVQHDANESLCVTRGRLLLSRWVAHDVHRPDSVSITLRDMLAMLRKEATKHWIERVRESRPWTLSTAAVLW